MGGLDARYMISKLGMAERVLTLTTVGTPHRGTSFADWGINRLARLLAPILEAIGIPHQAFYDLTTTRCGAFNEQVKDDLRVRYFSVAGRHEGGWHSPEWQLSHPIVTLAEGPNDGIVSVASATYGERCEIWMRPPYRLPRSVKKPSPQNGLMNRYEPFSPKNRPRSPRRWRPSMNWHVQPMTTTTRKS